MKNVKVLLCILASAAWVAGCGDAPKNGTSQSDPIFSINGKLTASAESMPNDIVGDLRVAVIWVSAELPLPPSGPPENVEDLEVFFSQSVEVTDTQLPASFTISLNELPPDAFMRRWTTESGQPDLDSGRYAIGFLVAFDDRDGDGEFTLPTVNTVELADPILHSSSYETLIVFVEGQAPIVSARRAAWRAPTIPDALLDFPVPPEFLLLEIYNEIPDTPGVLLDSLLADRIEPGFNVFEMAPNWAALEQPIVAYNRCVNRVRYYDLGDSELVGCEAISDGSVRGAAERQLETCLAAANGNPDASGVCAETFYTELTEPFGSPFWTRSGEDNVVELPMRDDPLAGRLMCPLPEQNGRPSDFELSTAQCSADGYAICVPQVPIAEAPTFCYGTFGTYVGTDLAFSPEPLPGWWPCQVADAPDPADAIARLSLFFEWLSSECSDAATP